MKKSAVLMALLVSPQMSGVALAHCPDSSGLAAANQRPVVVEGDYVVPSMRSLIGEDHVEKGVDGHCSVIFKTASDGSVSSVSIEFSGGASASGASATFEVSSKTRFLYSKCWSDGALEHDLDMLYGNENALDPAHSGDAFVAEGLTPEKTLYVIALVGKPAVRCTTVY